MARSLYRRRMDWLSGKGFMPFEYREIARNYTMFQLRTLSYLRSLIQSRRLYVSNLRSKGLGNKEIRDRIYALYDTKDWLTALGQPDVWQMVRAYRKTDIDSGEYFPVKRKGTHHPPSSGISKGDLQGQRQRRKRKLSDLEKYERGRGR